VRARWADVALVFLVFLVAAAGRLPDGNEAHYLAKARHYWDPSFGAGDFFLETRDAHVVFYWITAWMTTIFPLVAAAWIGRIVTWLLLAWAWVRLSYAITPRLGAPVLAAALWVIGVQVFDLAGEWVIGGFEAKGLAYVLVLLGLEALVRRQWDRVWILFGGATSLHVLVGGWSAVLAGFVWLTQRPRPALVRTIPAMAIGFALALLGLLPAAALNQGTPAEIVDRANEIYVYERLPHHLSPASLPAAEQTERYARHAGLLLVFAGLCVAGRVGQRHRRLQAWIWWAAAIAGIGLVVSIASPVAPAPAAAVLRYYWFRLNDVAMPLGVALFAIRGLSVIQLRQPRAGSSLAVVLALAAAMYLGIGLGARLRDPGPTSDPGLEPFSAWTDVCEWVRVHAPKNSRFLTPLESQTFVWRTGFGQVVTAKDVPQDAEGIVEWRRRIDDVWATGEDLTAASETLATYEPGRLRELGMKYGAQFLVTTAEPPVDLPRMYSNGGFSVYALSDVR